MSFIGKNASRILNSSYKRVNSAIHFIPKEGCFSHGTQPRFPVPILTRSIVGLSSHSRTNWNKQNHSLMCSCGCGISGMHTKGDKELVEFLNSEIDAEKQNKVAAVPKDIDGFVIKQDHAELELNKKFHDEEVKISLNVNHTVESEGDEDTADVLKSRPDFDVDIKIGKKTLSFTCQYNIPEQTEEGEEAPQEDLFGISEITFYDGEWDDKSYCVSGDILDAVMYDLLMNMLAERGITDPFVEKLSNVSTDFEHGLYVKLLENLNGFVQRK